jgi:DNA-binding SARP family transcriptional activator
MTEADETGLPFEIRLLGAVRAYHQGRALDLGGTRAKCLLAVLLLHPGQTLTKRRLIACAWQGDPPPTADDLVTSYISRLRRAFAPVADRIRLLASHPGYRVEIARGLVDAFRFADLLASARREREACEDESAAEHLRDALALWRESTAAFADLDSDWLSGQSNLLAERRFEALEQLAGIHLDAGRAADAVALLRPAVVACPTRETAAVILTKALAATGDWVRAAEIAACAARALADLGQNPGPALREAQTAALAHRVHAPSAQTQSGPRHQLPAATRAFTGREGELARLVDVCTSESGDSPPNGAVVCAIDGMAGVGKTALAVHLAHRVAGRFPDGQLYIDMHGYSPDIAPRSAGEALDTFLRTLGTAPSEVPRDLEERAAFYRERLIGTKTLIVLDNAANEAQIQPLLPSATGCAVLITSRRRLRALDDAYSLSLEVPPASDAIALFRTVAGPGRTAGNDPALAEIIELCGRLPLAVRIAAALLRHRAAWSLDHLAQRLRDRPHRVAAFRDGTRDLSSVFDLSYESLPPDRQLLFRMLGLVPGSDIDAYGLIELDRGIKALTDAKRP